MLCVTGHAIQSEVTGVTTPRPKPLAGVLGIDHQQRNSQIDAITQAQLSEHNREAKTCGTTGTLHRLYDSNHIVQLL